jgi:hypothetical protein
MSQPEIEARTMDRNVPNCIFYSVIDRLSRPRTDREIIDLRNVTSVSNN